MSGIATTPEDRQEHSYWPVSSRGSCTVPREPRAAREPAAAWRMSSPNAKWLSIPQLGCSDAFSGSDPTLSCNRKSGEEPEVGRRAGSRKKNQWGNHVRISANVGVSGAEVIGFYTAVKYSPSDRLPVSDNGRLRCRCHPSCRPRLGRSAIHASPHLSYLTVPLHQDHVQEI